MKRILMFAIMAVVALTSVSLFASCSDDTESKCTFTLEVGDNPLWSGSDTDAGLNYMTSVSDAYEAALGMTDSKISFDGAASGYTSSMKQKFESTTTPTALDPSVCSYTFTIQLVAYDYGSNGSSRSVIASKTFSNK